MKRKKFLFVSKESLSGDLALRLVEEGHEIKFYFEDKDSKDVYDGFFEKVDNWKRHQKWADLIVFDDENFGVYADRLRRAGKLVVGGSAYTDNLEVNRGFGQAELKKNGIAVAPFWRFNDCGKAISFILNHPDKYAFKPSGNAQSGDKKFTLIAQESDGSDLVAFLKQNRKVLGKKSPQFVLQKFIDGVEVAVGAFFNGHEFVFPINVNFEHKRLFPRDLGPMTGEMGTLMFWSRKNRIFNETLFRMQESLAKSKYVGYVDLNCIVNEEGIFPLEFTTRFGYPTIQIQLAGITMKAGQWLFRLAKGDSFRLGTKKGFQIGVVIATPPLLSEGSDTKVVNMFRDISITFQNGKPSHHVHIGDVKKDSKGIWRVAGNSGWCLVVTGTGKTVVQAKANAYREVKNIRIPHMFYRNDIGTRWFVERKKLKKWGYI